MKDRRIIGHGYNGAPAGLPHCIDVGCREVNNHCISVVHAEINAVLSCAKNGQSTYGASLYCTTKPCWECTKALINAGVKKVFYSRNYIDNRGNQDELFEQAGVELCKLDITTSVKKLILSGVVDIG